MSIESADQAASAASAAGGVLSALGLKAALGMAGAVLLYVGATPARPKDGSFNKTEFLTRLAVAGFASALCGDWAVDVVNNIAPVLMASKHPAPFWLAAGAPGWWVSRWVALWLYKQQDKDAAQVLKKVRDLDDPLHDQATGQP